MLLIDVWNEKSQDVNVVWDQFLQLLYVWSYEIVKSLQQFLDSLLEEISIIVANNIVIINKCLLFARDFYSQVDVFK